MCQVDTNVLFYLDARIDGTYHGTTLENNHAQLHLNTRDHRHAQMAHMVLEETKFSQLPEQQNQHQPQSLYNTLPCNPDHNFQAINQENDTGNYRLASGPALRSNVRESHSIAAVMNMSASPIVMHTPRSLTTILHAPPMVPPGLPSDVTISHQGWVAPYQSSHVYNLAVTAHITQESRAVQPQQQHITPCLNQTQDQQPAATSNSFPQRRISNPKAQVLAKGVPFAVIDSGQFKHRMSQFGKVDKMNVLEAKDGHEGRFVFIT